MNEKVLSPEQFEALPREEKRALARSLKKQGLPMPELLPRVRVQVSADQLLLEKALKVLDGSGVSFERFFDLALSNLILSSDGEE